MRLSDSEYNRLTVLKNLRSAQPTSRTELARLSGLTGGSITPIVGDLVRRGLVLEEKVPLAGRGRPRINLRINPDGAFIVATTFGDDIIPIEIVDLAGRSVFKCWKPLHHENVLDGLARTVATLLEEAIAESPVSIDRIAQAGIGLPAILDNRTGVVKYLESFDAGPCDFAGIVARQLGLPVRIDNNVNLLARAAHWFGDSANIDDFTLILLDLGVGAARYQNGQLVIGSHGIEAEFGHIKIVPEDGRPCHCGGRGCLQAYSAISGVVEQYSALRQMAPPHHLTMRDTLHDIARLAREGDVDTQALFRRAGHYLGVAVANHINVQDPDRIVLVAQEPTMIEAITPHFFAALHDATLEALRNLTRVTFRQLDEQDFSRGAAAMVLEQLYST